uniref:LRAT domain-containing protein n=1 Tax=Panagrolaimus sp. PS1159 TaxID=55785 RepID=A0AC35FZH5_9BILA
MEEEINDYNPQEFCEHIESVLRNEWMGDEIVEERIWGETPLKQHFVLVIKVTRESEVFSDGVLCKEQFLTLENARKYAKEKCKNLEKGEFGSTFSYRIRKLPLDVIERFEEYLKPGDHIQRNLDGFLPLASHEGVYIGDGMIAHINTEKSTAMAKTILTEKLEAHARIDPFQGFLSPENQEVRIIVHCLRRRSRKDIRAIAHRLADNDVIPEERYYSGDYHFTKQNCQHFASYCVLGKQWMTDNDPFFNKIIIKAANLIGSAAASKILSREKKKRSESESPGTSIEIVKDDDA